MNHTALSVPDFQIRPNVVFGPRSFMSDRTIKICDVIQVPRKVMPGASLSAAYLDTIPLVRPNRLRDKLRGRHLRRTVRVSDRPVIDLRFRCPQNWSHFLNFHMPMALWITQIFGADSSAPRLVVLPAKISRKWLDICDLFGFEVLQTDAPVAAAGYVYQADTEEIHRPPSRGWIIASGVLDRIRTASANAPSLPRNVFIARRDNRRLRNHAEIEALLSGLGFTTVYPEDFSALDQLRLFSETETIVAIHGAGVAPLLYRQIDGQLAHLVELIPCSTVSDIFRMMAQQVDVKWAGVRSRLDRSHLPGIYDLDATHYTGRHTEDFEVDPNSVELALEFLWSGRDPSRAPLDLQ